MAAAHGGGDTEFSNTSGLMSSILLLEALVRVLGGECSLGGDGVVNSEDEDKWGTGEIILWWAAFLDVILETVVAAIVGDRRAKYSFGCFRSRIIAWAKTEFRRRVNGRVSAGDFAKFWKKNSLWIDHHKLTFIRNQNKPYKIEVPLSTILEICNNILFWRK